MSNPEVVLATILD